MLSSTVIFSKTKTYSISGTIVSESTNETLPGARISLKGLKNGTVSDSRGNFLINNIENGEYTIEVSYIGYRDSEMKVNINDSDVDIEFRLEETYINTEAVVVTATRAPKALKDVPMLTELVTSQEMRANGSVTAMDALEDMSSVDFTPNVHGANVSMHGLGPEYVLFLLDGERIAGDMRGNVNFSRLNAGNIQRIEIVKGAASTLYGSKAIGGVVNIITKKSDRPFELNLNSRYSKFNELDLGASAVINYEWISSKTDFYFKRSDGYDLTPETVFHTVDKYDDITITQRFDFKPTDNLKIRTSGTFYTLERYDAASEYWFKHRKYYDYTYNLGADYEFDNNFTLKGSWYSDTYETYDVLEKLGDEERLSDRHRYNVGRILAGINLFANHEISAGGEFIDENVFSPRIQDTSHSSQNYVLFAQDAIGVTDNLSFVPGFRLDMHSEFGTYLTPKISAMYQWLPLNFRATYGLGFKAPSLKELYMNWDHGGAGPFVYGNNDLQPEASSYYSFSVEFISGLFNGSVSFFRNDLEDMIDVRPEAGEPNTFYYSNVHRAMTQGVEFRMKHEIGRGINISGGYTYVDTEDKSTGRPLLSRANHFGTAKLEYIGHDFGFNANIRAKFVGSKLFDEIVNEVTGELTRYRQSPYIIWKFTAGKELLDMFYLTFGVDNIFDYIDKQYLITPGRRFYLGLNFNYQKE